MADEEEAGMTFLTIPEVAKLLRVSNATAYRMREDGELPAVKVRGQWRISAALLAQKFSPAEPEELR